MRRKASEKIEMFKDGLFENGSYKLVALFISLILWLTILGRREFVVNKEVEVDFTTAENMIVSYQSDEKIRVKLSGAQPLLKRYKSANQALQISLADKEPGKYEIEMNLARIDAPNGIKVLSIKPKSIRVEITSQKN